MAPSGSALKDVVLAVAIVGGVLGALFIYTGVWPPMVVVESGSMMHGVTCPAQDSNSDGRIDAAEQELCSAHVGYGKFGTIDPGDMVFVKAVSKRDEVVPMAEAAARQPDGRNYGKPGDVLVYFPFGNTQLTPIIHRAIAYVEVSGVDPNCERTGNPGAGVAYRVFWEGRAHNFGPQGIYLPGMGFGAPGYSDDSGYKPCWSGYITKGDNPVTNKLPDQAQGGGRNSRGLPNQPIQMDWVQGKAVGELPWFGLIKLALSGQSNYQTPCVISGVPTWQRNDPACENGKAVQVLNAWAPPDLWVMLGVSLAVIAIAPLAYDLYSIQQGRRRAEMVARGEDPGPTLGERIRLILQDKLGQRGSARAGGNPGNPGPEEGADPRRAFEQPPPPPPPPSGSPGGSGSGTKFERVEKK